MVYVWFSKYIFLYFSLNFYKDFIVCVFFETYYIKKKIVKIVWCLLCVG